MADPVDLQRLRDFSDGSAAGLRTLIDIFVTETGVTFRQLRRAVETADAGAIKLLSHRAGGSVSACGAARLWSLLQQLEFPPPGGRDDRADAATMQAVVNEFETVKRFLLAYMEELAE